MAEAGGPLPPWRLVTNHGVVLLTLAQQPDTRIRELAAVTGITERACQRILNDLCDEGYVARRRVGRRNTYRVDRTMPMRHPALRANDVARLLGLLGPDFAPRWFAEPAAATA